MLQICRARARARAVLSDLAKLRPSIAGIPRGRRIGLLGGSFDPAHRGHLAISHAALVGLELDEVWWLISPQNPLKPQPRAQARRLDQARRLAAGDRRIKVTDIEAALGTRYTVDTLAALARRLPQVRFVWLMGADNLAQIHLWKGWQKIFRSMPIAVFDRPGYAASALAGIGARAFARCRVTGGALRRLANAKPPAWAFLFGRLDPESSSRLRSQRQK